MIIMKQYRARNLILMAVTGLMLLTLNSAMAQEKKSTTGSQWSAAQMPIAQISEAFTAAYNKGDVKAIRGFFAPDARLITIDGDVLDGAEEIADLFAAGFDSNPGVSMKNETRSIRLIGESVAIESGFTETTTPADKKPDTVAYHTIHVKRNGQWKIFDVIEAEPARIAGTVEHAEKLAELDFLVGEWLEEAEGGLVHHRARWSANHTYLLIDYQLEQDKKLVTIATQRIGWDAKNKAIRSWLFEEDGGHGSGLWVKSATGDEWLIKSEAVLADGRQVSLSSRLTRTATDRIVISGYDRTAEGKSIPDMPARGLTKKPPAPATKKATR
jgi:uncharacterized protein (TIGR02246 family)